MIERRKVSVLRRNMSAAAAAAVAVTAAVTTTAALSSMILVAEAFSATAPVYNQRRRAAATAAAGHTTTRTPASKTLTALHMAATATPYWDDSNFFNEDGGAGAGAGDDGHSSSSSDSASSPYYRSVQQQQQDSSNNNNNNNKFVTGDALHRLRHQVLAMRLELHEARREHQRLVDSYQRHSMSSSSLSNPQMGDDVARRVEEARERVKQLETTIMKTQQVDAEFVYTVSLERKALALQDGDFVQAHKWEQHASEARAALPQFQLEGLWVGRYGVDEDDDDDNDDEADDDRYTTISSSSGRISTSSTSRGYELINITYVGDVLTARKVTTGGKNVPKGAETFMVDLSPLSSKIPSSASASSPDVLSPIELGDAAAKQWGCKYLQRFAGQGQVAAENFEDSQWVDGQLILVNQYFSFAWLPIGHQVFFGRPTPELVLKLMRDEQKRENGGHGCATRAFLEKCWVETEHLEDDMDVRPDGIVVNSKNLASSDHPAHKTASTIIDYYSDEDCFE